QQADQHVGFDAVGESVVDGPQIQVVGFDAAEVAFGPKWMISESIRRRGISVGEVSYKGHRYPAEIIAHCVWLYHRFPLSFREVEELMLVRGVIVTYETIRQWCAKFGPGQAPGLHRRQPPPGYKWLLDELFLTINARRHYLWRAVDQDGYVLDILV